MSRKPRAEDFNSTAPAYPRAGMYPGTLDFREGMLPNAAAAQLYGAPYGAFAASPFAAPAANPFAAPAASPFAAPAANPFAAPAPSPFADLHALQAAAAARAAPEVNPLLALQHQQLLQQQALQQALLQQQAASSAAGMPLTPGVQAELAYANMLAAAAKPAATPRAARRRAAAKTAATPDMKAEIARCLDRRGKQGAYS
jgi:hypothetical protein